MSDTAIAAVCGAIVQIALAFVAYLKIRSELKYGSAKAKEAADSAADAKTATATVEKKLDANTRITTEVGTEAIRNAGAAASAAAEAKTQVEGLTKKLNGGIDVAIAEQLRPVHKALVEHATQDEHNVNELNTKLSELTAYVHARNHKADNDIHTMTMKLEAILILVRGEGPAGGAGK